MQEGKPEKGTSSKSLGANSNSDDVTQHDHDGVGAEAKVKGIIANNR